MKYPESDAKSDIAKLEAALTERGRCDTERFLSIERVIEAKIEAQDRLMVAKVEAQDRLMHALMQAGKDAAQKQENAQSGVNERLNETRGQLADQAATLMPRKETESLVAGLRENIERIMLEASTAREALRTEMRLLVDAVRKEVADLREWRSERSGRQSQEGAERVASRFALTTGISITALVLSGGIALYLSVAH